ncbi:MAG: cobaltochelatase subunit CobN [Myxococcales bacterium]|nr:cobaltochelatase subunit CobN [Myxococcales bacterium]
MHIDFRDSPGLGVVQPIDLNQTPSELVFLSFSDSDLGAFAAGWHRSVGRLPSLRLANLSTLMHPLSVDEYAEKTLRFSKIILVRLIGGESYWPYGLSVLKTLHKDYKVALAILPADGREDPRLEELSTLPSSALRQLQKLCDAGGEKAAEAALSQLALAAGLSAHPVLGPQTVPSMGFYDPVEGIYSKPPPPSRKEAWVIFYRSYLTAADTAPIDQLLEALTHAGFDARGVFVISLKAQEVRKWVSDTVHNRKLAAVVNATAFSAQGPQGTTPFDTFQCPIFQVALSTSQESQWAVSDRGLSPTDLAMNVTLPEIDGRIFAGVVSFKEPQPKDPELQYARYVHTPHAERIERVVHRVSAWHQLASTPHAQQRIAVILSTYPGKAYQMAHAVGLDALASTQHLLHRLAQEGYALPPDLPHGQKLIHALASEQASMSLRTYQAAVERISPSFHETLSSTWGPPEDDPYYQNGALHFSAIRLGSVWVALQPERGTTSQREIEYHDLSRVPCHSYVAFYLWLQSMEIHALIHMGAHGTLEWLPGKSVALSAECWPDLLTAGVPVIYPFILNDPGEAAQAKRRLGAVTVGHVPPPLASGDSPEELLELERLLDEFSTADGLDFPRRERLIHEIRREAQATGVEADLNLPPTVSPAEALTRIDRFVCDIKESQYGEGLHILGTGEWGTHELSGILTALSGSQIAPGPSGSPYRGQGDVLPPGRNLFSVDSRAVPTRNAYAQGVKLAEELCRRHIQEEGDYLRRLVIDLWGSATMRTAGEDFAMALHLAGLKPIWDPSTGRVTKVGVLELSLLGRPRVEVTLRVSGVFRDIFPGLAQWFERGTLRLSEQDEPEDMNPYRQQRARVFAPKPGSYGVSMGPLMGTFSEEARCAAGEAWLKASSWSFRANGELLPDRDNLEQQVLQAEAFVHTHDLPESDLLLAADFAAHEGGFAAAVARLEGNTPAMYHLDNTRPERPQARTIKEEIARVVRGRAANPQWISGMMEHGYRGAAEITATLDHLAAFAHLARVVEAHLFDAYYDATLGNDQVVAFMKEHNPQALDSLKLTFHNAKQHGLWQTLRNDIAALISEEDPR